MPDYQAPLTRPSLILRLRKSDDLRAWKEFVEIYEPLIYAIARKRLQDADSEDVTQEVLTRVAKSIDNWDPDPSKGSFRGWLATITRNLVIQLFRESNRRPATGLDSHIGELPDTFSNGSSLRAREFDLERERQLFIWAARKIQPRFEPKTWQAFWLTAVEGEAVASVADGLVTTKAQIYVARSRVMSLLKRTVERTEFDSIVDGVER